MESRHTSGSSSTVTELSIVFSTTSADMGGGCVDVSNESISTTSVADLMHVTGLTALRGVLNIRGELFIGGEGTVGGVKLENMSIRLILWWDNIMIAQVLD